MLRKPKNKDFKKTGFFGTEGGNIMFLDKVGETITNKGKDVAKKAKEIAEVVSLNNQISTQEDAINKVFLEIGKSVYQLKEEWISTELAEKFSLVDSAYEEIGRLKKEIMTLKGVKKCPGCGAEVANGSAYCPDCGTQMPEEPKAAEETAPKETAEEETPESVKCPNCGKESDFGTAFCSDCGTKLKD